MQWHGESKKRTCGCPNLESSAICQLLFALLHLNHVARRAAASYFAHAHDYQLGKIVERLGMRRRLASQHGRLSAVAALADLRIKLNGAQKRHGKFPRGPLHAAFGKNVDLLMAMWTNKVAHVLHQAQDVDASGAEHLNGFAPILQRNISRSRNHDGPRERNGLEK